MMGSVWPDGKSLIEQPYRLILAFGIISEIEALCKKNEKRQ